MVTTLWGLSGIFATLWITIGVYWVAKQYPNYNHRQQFCSELGAIGSPTQKLSPRVNNYPLAVLFCAFGCYLVSFYDRSFALFFTGLMVIFHGLGTWVAGYFAMDQDPYTKTPSKSCTIHSWAGFVMLLSLLVGQISCVLAPSSVLIPLWLRIFSLLTLAIAIYYLIAMAKAAKQQRDAGLYQRLSYWSKLLWLSALSTHLVTAQNFS